MTNRHSELVAALIAIAVAVSSASAHADDAPDVTQARDEFLRGAALVKNAQWAEALAEFERSAAARPHAVTHHNIGACERAMGRYTLARETFLRARAQNEASQGAELPQGVLTEMTGYLDEIDRLLVNVALSLDPPGFASIAIDGRPLARSTGVTPEPVYVGGVRAPGPPEAAPGSTFHVLLDPGAHVFAITRKGFSDGVVNKTFAPGSAVDLRLELNKLPATLHITSEPLGAAASLEGVDVGATPLDLSRPGGTYLVTVRKAGFLSYESRISAQPGESVNLFAKLPVDKPSIAQRWWFWTGLGVLVVGGALAAYFIAVSQQEAQRPALNGGGLGWTIPVP
ncbi:hypothetical protein BH09MYX1_BH09MYX1_29050 [soil metagenome]